MRHKLIRLCLLFVIVAMMPGLGGCAGLGLTPTPEPVTLKFTVSEYAMPVERLVEEFNLKHPWITVEYYKVGTMGGSQVEQFVRAGSTDIFRAPREAMAWAAEGLVKPLDEIQLDDWSEIRDDYYGGLWEALASQGVQFGIPAGMDIYVSYVNSQQAEALGVDLPPDSWDMFDFIEFVNATNSWNESGMSDASLIGFCTDPQAMDPIVFTYMHGGGIVDNIENPRQALLDDPLTIEATQTYTDLFTRYRVAPSLQVARRFYPRGGVYEAQIRGRCGAWFSWFSERGGADVYAWQNEWKMYRLPQDQVNMEMGNVEGYYVTANCQHPKEALIFLRFLSDRWDAAGQLLPPRVSQQLDSSYRETLTEELAAVVDSFSDEIIFLPGGYTPALEAVGVAYYTAIGQIIAEDLDVASLLEQAQEQVGASLE